MPIQMKSRLIVGLWLLLVALPLHAAEPKKRMEYEDQQAYMRLVRRTPEQLAAFYLGREFPRAAIDKILETCFITPIVHNKSLEAMWIDLDDWRFEVNGKAVPRIKRDYWAAKWREVGLPQGFQSTFGWTLLPEVRDLRTDEGAGGSVAIPWQDKPFRLAAHFKTGLDKKGPEKIIVFEGVTCVQDEDPPE